jgi:hypothetical protein
LGDDDEEEEEREKVKSMKIFTSQLKPQEHLERRHAHAAERANNGGCCSAPTRLEYTHK